jgi:death-on-curing family protein
MRIKYPTVQDIVEINKKVLEEVQVNKHDRHFVLNLDAIKNAITSAKVRKGDLYDKASVLLVKLIQNHPFKSTNKRTAFVAAMSFIETNSGSPIEYDPMILQGVRERFYKVEDVKRWLKG